MSVLDAQGRDTETLWKAKAVFRWLSDPAVVREAGIAANMVTVVKDMAHTYSMATSELSDEQREMCEAWIASVAKILVGRRQARRLIARSLVKRGVPRKQAMEALRRLGAEE